MYCVSGLSVRLSFSNSCSGVSHDVNHGMLRKVRSHNLFTTPITYFRVTWGLHISRGLPGSRDTSPVLLKTSNFVLTSPVAVNSSYPRMIYLYLEAGRFENKLSKDGIGLFPHWSSKALFILFNTYCIWFSMLSRNARSTLP